MGSRLLNTTPDLVWAFARAAKEQHEEDAASSPDEDAAPAAANGGPGVAEEEQTSGGGGRRRSSLVMFASNLISKKCECNQPAGTPRLNLSHSAIGPAPVQPPVPTLDLEVFAR